MLLSGKLLYLNFPNFLAMGIFDDKLKKAWGDFHTPYQQICHDGISEKTLDSSAYLKSGGEFMIPSFWVIFLQILS